MECHEGATMIKTYRGVLADGGQDQIRLKTNRGDIGYRIVKFQVISVSPGAANVEAIVKIFKIKQTAGSITGTVDFGDGNLLATAYYTGQDNHAYLENTLGPIIFDQEIFNQDIYVTSVDVDSSTSINYYLELEQVKLNDNESTMATLQSLRTVASK